MDQGQHSSIVGFIWNIADDVLRDVYVRGKYRDVILPMTVLRRLDAVLEPTKQDVLEMKKKLDAANISNQDAALKQAAKQAFYNTSQFSLRDLKARSTQQKLKADFEDYLDGFSPNVQDILENFEFRNQIPRLIKADVLGSLIEKFTDTSVNLSPNAVLNSDGSIRLPGLDNHSMGTVFEELIRRFNEENNEEAGEHFTPRDVVKVMADMIFLPIADKIESGTYLVYDGACGTGGMLTVAEDRLQELADEHNKKVSIHLFGQEINGETYAICKADLLLKGDGVAADNIIGGSDRSTLSNDAFPSKEFDFMVSNPPYGKSWKTDLDRMGGKGDITDSRFVIEHAGIPDYSMLTRSSDGQLMFLVNMLSKMKSNTSLGSRLASVHNGSALFTGDAGQGESNIRRWILENDWLEAIVALPEDMFYNTPLATFIWVLSNRKSNQKKNKVQLIDATKWFEPMRRSLGKKSCQLSDANIRKITEAFLAFEEGEYSRILRNEEFGYWEVVIERPLRLSLKFSNDDVSNFIARCDACGETLLGKVTASVLNSGGLSQNDFNTFIRRVEQEAKQQKLKLNSAKTKLIRECLTIRNSEAPPVLSRVHSKGCTEVNPIQGRFHGTGEYAGSVVEYESDPQLRDTEKVPLSGVDGIAGFLAREVHPYYPDAWFSPDTAKIGYQINFNEYFFKPITSRPLEEVRKQILSLARETEGLLAEIIGA